MNNNQIDTLAMKRQIQERIADATCDMTPEALLAYFHQRIATSRFAAFVEPTPTEAAIRRSNVRTFERSNAQRFNANAHHHPLRAN